MFKSEEDDALSAAGAERERAGESAPDPEHKAPSHDQPTLCLSSSPP